jgi:hypothetical protein
MADLYRSPYSNQVSLVVKKCIYCGMQHNHGVGEGHRVAHCFDKKTGKSLRVGGYTLKIDWRNEKNQSLREEYEMYLQEVSGNKIR